MVFELDQNISMTLICTAQRRLGPVGSQIIIKYICLYLVMSLTNVFSYYKNYQIARVFSQFLLTVKKGRRD